LHHPVWHLCDCTLLPGRIETQYLLLKYGQLHRWHLQKIDDKGSMVNGGQPRTRTGRIPHEHGGQASSLYTPMQSNGKPVRVISKLSIAHSHAHSHMPYHQRAQAHNSALNLLSIYRIYEVGQEPLKPRTYHSKIRISTHGRF
jgi:hypothetical protein